MLIIPRGKDESIVIGDSIIITVEEINGEEILLRIEHPEDTSISQDELLGAGELGAS